MMMVCGLMAMQTWAQKVSVRWELSNPDNLADAVTIGDEKGLLTNSFLKGAHIAQQLQAYHPIVLCHRNGFLPQN